MVKTAPDFAKREKIVYSRGTVTTASDTVKERELKKNDLAEPRFKDSNCGPPVHLPKDEVCDSTHSA